jgi:hypothetical protein
MLEIRFHPESDEPVLVAAAADYQRLWDAEGRRIVERLAALTGLRFAERVINALVFDGPSHCHPLRLRAGYDGETKLGTLIHELCHRLLRGNRRRLGLPVGLTNSDVGFTRLFAGARPSRSSPGSPPTGRSARRAGRRPRQPRVR